MATYQFSALSSGQAITFDPDADLLNFDLADVAAADIDGSSFLLGTGDDDALAGGSGDDLLVGFGGDDTLDGGFGNDTLKGGNGDDLLDGGFGADLVSGGNGNDTLRSHDFTDDGHGPDTLDGGRGNDTYDLRHDPFADQLVPVLEDSGGVDTVLTNHRFVLPDGFENLTLFEATGGTGNALDNVITTHTNEPHSYVIDGRAGNDTLIGGDDSDTMTGGAGNDVFVFLRPTDPFEIRFDQVEDFVSGTDRLQFDNAGYTELGAAADFTADDARFASGAGLTSGQDASDRLIYDSLNGDLYYDLDGSGDAESVFVAHFTGAPGLAATDITVI